MRLPQFTTRRLMAVIAVAGLIFAVYLTLHRRTARFRLLAQVHASHAGFRTFAINASGQLIASEDPGAKLSNARKSWHFDLFKKYQRAARYPWLPVSPDPTPPK